MQTPLQQAYPSGQAWPQAPQLAASLPSSLQASPHLDWPVGQAGSWHLPPAQVWPLAHLLPQAPLAQLWPVAQALPHEPQLAGSLAVFLHTPLQQF